MTQAQQTGYDGKTLYRWRIHAKGRKFITWAPTELEALTKFYLHRGFNADQIEASIGEEAREFQGSRS